MMKWNEDDDENGDNDEDDDGAVPLLLLLMMKFTSKNVLNLQLCMQLFQPPEICLNPTDKFFSKYPKYAKMMVIMIIASINKEAQYKIYDYAYKKIFQPPEISLNLRNDTLKK